MYKWRFIIIGIMVGMTIFIIFSTLVMEKQAYALSCAFPSVEEKLEISEYVFKGKVVDNGGEERGYPVFRKVHTFEVYESWKGVSDPQITLWSGKSLVKDKTYLIYASTNGSGDIVSGICNGISTGRMMINEIRLLGDLLGDSVIIQEEILKPRFVWSDQTIYTRISIVFIALFFAILITTGVRKIYLKIKLRN